MEPLGPISGAGAEAAVAAAIAAVAAAAEATPKFLANSFPATPRDLCISPLLAAEDFIAAGASPRGPTLL